MSDFSQARERYRKHRSITSELLEEEALHAYKLRVDVVSIGDDVLRRVRRDWYEVAERQVTWDWESNIIKPLWGAGPRCLALAFLVKGELCGLMAARLSRRKRWLSLTHLEGAPSNHPLKGRILPLAARGLLIYRAVIAEKGQAEKIGVRILRPTDEALPYYLTQGYSLSNDTKWLRSMDIVLPTGE